MSHDLELALAAVTADRLGMFAGRVHCFDEVESTNDIVLGWADAGGQEGLAAIAEAQTRGRGRLGRSWSSPPGAGIYLSMLLRPGDDVARFLTLMAGVAVTEGIEASTGLRTALKWPNDVCVAGSNGTWRKVAGILAEGGSTARGQRHVVLGVGINVLPAAYPPDVSARATSLESEVGRAVDRAAVAVECLGALSRRYEALGTLGSASLVAAWRQRAIGTFGRAVEWDDEGGPNRGIASGIDESGALLIRTERGTRRVIAGEVRWV